MKFPDYFSSKAEDYSRYRPRYPAALFDWLASLSPRRDFAWDCATGNGQAAVELSRRFARVVATDASEEQIAHAERDPKITYRVALAEESGLETGSVDLVTVAQALHWFDLPRFYAEIARVLVPGGVMAAWSYQLARVDAAVDAVIRRLYLAVGPYWPPERAPVESGYVSLPFPFPELPPPSFVMEELWDLSRLIGYLGTWSAVQRCREKTGRDPIEAIRAEVKRAWGDPRTPRIVRWPLRLRVGRKK